MWSIWSLLGHDCICQPPRLWNLWNPIDLDRAGGPAVCQWCFEDFTKGSAVSSALDHPQNSPWSWAWKAFITRCPLSLCEANLLPFVWQGGPEWKTCSQPLEDNTLQARASLQVMSPLSLDYLGGHTTSWLRLQTAQRKWHQRGRHILIWLTDPNHPIWILNLFEFITICIVQNVQMYLNVLNSNKTW